MTSQCWGNDLWMTCLGKSRNREFGELVGQGLTTLNALAEMRGQKKLVEGYHTLRIFKELVGEKTGQYPIMMILHQIIYGNGDSLLIMT